MTMTEKNNIEIIGGKTIIDIRKTGLLKAVTIIKIKSSLSK